MLSTSPLRLSARNIPSILVSFLSRWKKCAYKLCCFYTSEEKQHSHNPKISLSLSHTSLVHYLTKHGTTSARQCLTELYLTSKSQKRNGEKLEQTQIPLFSVFAPVCLFLLLKGLLLDHPFPHEQMILSQEVLGETAMKLTLVFISSALSP